MSEPTPMTDEKLLSWSLTNSELRAAIGKQSLGFGGDNIQNRVVDADFARTLERELTTARDALRLCQSRAERAEQAAAGAENELIQNRAMRDAARASLERVDADYDEECQKRAHVQSLLNAARAEIASLTAEVAWLKASAEIDW